MIFYLFKSIDGNLNSIDETFSFILLKEVLNAFFATILLLTTDETLEYKVIAPITARKPTARQQTHLAIFFITEVVFLGFCL